MLISGILLASFLPALALFNPFPVVSLLFIISHSLQQIAGKILTLSAMRMSLCLTASFHRAAVSPKRLLHVDAAGAVHLLAIK